MVIFGKDYDGRGKVGGRRAVGVCEWMFCARERGGHGRSLVGDKMWEIGGAEVVCGQLSVCIFFFKLKNYFSSNF